MRLFKWLHLFVVAFRVLNFVHLDLSINTLLVHFSNFLLSLLVHRLEDLLLVLLKRLLLDQLGNLWVLWENLFVDKISCKGVALYIDVDCHIDELGFRFVHHIMITNNEFFRVLDHIIR